MTAVSSSDALKRVLLALHTFRHFNHGTLALYRGERDAAGRKIGLFDVPDPFFRLATQLAGNDNPAAVRLWCDGDVVVADTLDRHPLVGQRRWSADLADGRLRIWTEAYERENGWTNRLGAAFGARLLQRLIWTAYLVHTANWSRWAGPVASQDLVRIQIETCVGNPWPPAPADAKDCGD